ncbi:tudor domain-containing protein 1 [Lithobates pipiens]
MDKRAGIHLSLRKPISPPQMFGNVAAGPGRDSYPITGIIHHDKRAPNGLPSAGDSNLNPRNIAQPIMEKQEQKNCNNVFSIGNHPAIFETREPARNCHSCGLFGSRRCSRCHNTYYCSIECQKRDWKMHSIICKPTTTKLTDEEKSHNDREAKAFTKPSGISVSKPNKKDDGRRLMLCDLNLETLREGTEIQGCVTEFSSPTNFFVQDCSSKSIEIIVKISVLLNNIYSSLENVRKDYIPVIQEVCAAKYSEDQQWYRVLVCSVEMNMKTAQVLYIDYGSQDTLAFCDLQPMHKDLDLATPPCAVNFRVAHTLVPPCGWSPECLVDLKRLLMGQKFLFRIVKVEEEDLPRYSVEVTLPKSGKLLHKLMEEKGYSFPSRNSELNSAEAVAALEKSPVEPIEKKPSCTGSESPDMQGKPVSFSVGDQFEALITVFHNPEMFFCQQVQTAKQLAELVAAMNKKCSALNTTLISLPEPGNLCCAQFTADNNWYRASIVKHISEDTALVGYLDFGNTETLHISRLRPIDIDMLQTPFHAIQCCLAGVKPPSGTWSSEAIHTIGALVMNKVFTAVVVSESEGTLSLDLIDESATPPVAVSQHLIAAGLSEAEKFASDSLPTIQKEEVSPREPSQLGWTQLPLGQEREVIVCMLQSPGDFFCHIYNLTDLSSLNDLNVSLGQYCIQHVSEGYTPNKGDVCGAFFSDDRNWYRGQVKDFTSGGAATVHFLDYGNTEEVAVDKLCKIPSDFLQLPFQAVKCSLAGVKPHGEKWDLIASKKFQDFVAGIKLLAKAVCRKENGYIVELVVSESRKAITDVLLAEKVALPDDFKTNDADVETGPGSAAKKTDEGSSQVCSNKELNPAKETKVSPVQNFAAKEQTSSSHRDPYSSQPVRLNSTQPALQEIGSAKAATIPPKESFSHNSTASPSGENRSGNAEPSLPKEFNSSYSSPTYQTKFNTSDKSTNSVNGRLSTQRRSASVNLEPSRQRGFNSVSSPVRSPSRLLSTHATSSPLKNGLVSVKDSPSLPQELKSTRVSHKQSSSFLEARGVSVAQSWASVDLQLNEPLAACVLRVRSPDLMYVFPKENRVDVEKLQQVMMDMFSYCNAETDQPAYIPSVGDACCAKFSADGQWYRAVILEVLDSTVEIAYADYGNLETLPFSCLRPVKESFLCTPMQITRCRLYGVAPVSNQWSSEGTQVLSSLLLGADVVLVARSVEAGIYSVSMEKKHGAENIDVGQKLVMDGSAKCAEAVSSTNVHEDKDGCCCCCQEFRKRMMLTKDLKHTSDTITEKLTCEITDLGRRTSELEHRADEIEILTSNHSDLEALCEDNLTAVPSRGL